MSSETNVFLLAAGLGTRFKPLTLTYPKPSIPFLNVPMGFYQFRYLNHLTVANLVVNTFHLPEKVQSLYENQSYFKDKIHFSHEKGQILGSAGGLKKASAFMDLTKPILMMNADEIYFTNDEAFLKKAYKQHIDNKNLATLIVMKHPEAGKKFGSVWADGRKVKNISKQAAVDPLQNWHYIGAMFISTEILKQIPEHVETNIFYDVVIKQLDQLKVEIYPIDCSWYETGNPKDFIQATQAVLASLDSKTLAFINQFDPSVLVKNDGASSLVSSKAQVGSTKLKGFNVISESVNSPPETITDSILFDNEVLKASDY